MRRGTRVGQAYVALSVDGDGINDTIGDAFDDIDFSHIEEGTDRASKRAAAKMRQNLRNEIKSLDFSEALANIGTAIDNDEQVGRGLAKKIGKAFDDGKLKDLIQRVARKSGADFGTEFDHIVNKAVLDTLETSIENARGGDISNLFSFEQNGVETQGPIFQRAVDLAERRIQEFHREQDSLRADAKKAEKDQTKFLETQERIRTDFIGKFEDSRLRLHEQSTRAIERDDQGLLKSQEALYESLLRMEKNKTDFVGRFAEARLRLQEQNNEAIRKSDEETFKASERLLREQQKAQFDALARTFDDEKFNRYARLAQERLSKIKIRPTLDEATLAETQRRIAASLERIDDLKIKLDLDLPARELAEIRAQLEAVTRGLNVDLDTVDRNRPMPGQQQGRGAGFDAGRLFGAGSRNNALNLFGKSVGGIVTLLDKAKDAGVTMFQVFNRGFQSAGENASVFTRLLSGGGAVGGSIFSTIAATAPSAVLGIAAVSAAATILVSILSALLAIVVALAATIASALVGALAVAGGAMGALLAAGVLLTAMFTSLGDAQKKLLGDSFGPVRETFLQLGQIMAKPIFAGQNSPVEQWATNIRKSLLLLAPVAQVMGKAFAEAGIILTKSFTGPGFQAFAQGLATFLPGIVTQLSSALGQFLNGITGLFAALLPFVLRFSVYLNDVATRFSAFVNSADGKNKIVDFVERSLESLAAFRRFLGAVGGLINKLLFSKEGQQAGNSIFDKMTAGVKRFVAFIGQEDRLQKWFQEGVEFAKALGDAIRVAGLALAALNNAGVIDALGAIFSTIEKITSAFAALPDAIQANIVKFALLTAVALKLRSALIAAAAANAANVASGAASAGVFGRMGASAGAAAGKISLLKGAGALGGLVALTDASNRTSKGLGALQGAAGGAAIGFAVGGPLGAAIGGIGGGLLGLATSGGKAADSIDEVGEAAARQAANVSSFAGTIDAATGSFTNLAAAEASRQLQTNGALALANRYNYSLRDTQLAALGNQSALERLNRTLDAQIAAGGRFVSIGGGMSKSLKDGRVVTDAQAQAFEGAGENAQIFKDKLAEVAGAARTAASQAILTSIAAGTLGSELQNIPQGILIDIATNGVDAARRGIEELIRTQGLTERQIEILLGVAGLENTLSDIDAVRRAANASAGVRDIIYRISTSGVPPLLRAPVSPILTSLLGGSKPAPVLPPTPKVTLPKLPQGSIGGGSSGGGGGGSTGPSAADKAEEQARKLKAFNDAIRRVYKQIREGLKDLADSTDPKAVKSTLGSLIDSLREATADLGPKAQRLAKATATLLRAQQKIRPQRVENLLDGGKIPKGTTLAEFAAARERVALRLERANAKLTAAIALRDDYKRAVTDAVKTFGGLLTAQAKTIDGVEQALTAADITDNLQDRLNKIKAFQANLRLLVASGLSNAAYKQIVDGGVEEGGAFAAALVAGGAGAIQQVNGLVSQIDAAANQLGSQTSSRMYQAGVDAAKGLVAGLNSLSAQLDSAAARLGNTIAAAVKRSLGIKSPSRVMIDSMGSVGDGLVLGLDAQQKRVNGAAGRLSDQIAVSPEVAAYQASQSAAAPVSGNQPDPRFRDLVIHTPTEDPVAVALETLNEVTGRL